MSTIRALLGILGGAAAGALIGLAVMRLLTPGWTGVLVSAVSVAVIGIELIRLLERDKQRMRAGRDAVWQQRIAQQMERNPR